MALIEDGIGKGFKARVDSKNRLRSHVVDEPEMHAASEDGDAYAWASETYDPAAADTILLVKNTGNPNLHIEFVYLSTDVDTVATIHLPTTEVTPTGTAITGTNFNTGSSNVAEASAIRDETNNTQGNVIWSGEIYAASGPYRVDLQGALILAKNKSVGVDYVADVAACDVTIFGFFNAD